MKGIELSVPAKPYIEALQKEGILVIPSGTNVIRLLPPLILEEEHVNILIQVLDSLFWLLSFFVAKDSFWLL